MENNYKSSFFSDGRTLNVDDSAAIAILLLPEQNFFLMHACVFLNVADILIAGMRNLSELVSSISMNKHKIDINNNRL